MPFNLIDYIVKTKKLQQKDLAEMLKVSRAQISKWKAGETIPCDRKRELINIADLFGDNPEWSIFAKTKENSDSWINYVSVMHDRGIDYIKSQSLQEEPEFEVPYILLQLSKMGVNLPTVAPKAENLKKEDYDYTDFDELIRDYLNCYGALSGWCSFFLTSECTSGIQAEISDYMIEYALCFVDERLLIANGADMALIDSHKDYSIKWLRNTIEKMCEIMRDKDRPFRTDYFDLLDYDIGTLSDQVAFYPSTKKKVTDYFSCSEKFLLAEIENIKNMIKELSQKIDSFTDRRKKGFSS